MQMIFISHRGNITGPNPLKENSLDHIYGAINLGFDVEVDLWKVGENFFTGHDKPKEHIDPFTDLPFTKIWYHCKNKEVLSYFVKNLPNIGFKFFWHETDRYTLVANSLYIWTFPTASLVDRSIFVMPEKSYDDFVKASISESCSGVCSDHIFQIRKEYSDFHGIESPKKDATWDG
jgi:hypothetical protein